MVKLKTAEIPEKSSLWLEIIINNAGDTNKFVKNVAVSWAKNINK